MGWHVGILLISLGVLLYVSYDLGCLPVKSMSVIHFIGSMGAGTNNASAAFVAATGQIRRVLRFKESKPYEFTSRDRSSKAQCRSECFKITKSRNRFWVTTVLLGSYMR